MLKHDVFDLEYFQKNGILSSKSIIEVLKQSCLKFANKTALIEAEQQVSYQELDVFIEKIATSFVRLGLQKGDRILLELPSSIGFTLILLAAIRIGVIPVLALPGQKERDIVALTKLAEPKIFFVMQKWVNIDYSSVISSVKSTCPNVSVFVCPPNDNGTPDISNLLVDEVIDNIAFPKAFDDALFLLSGGTTGTPKLIPRTHASYIYNANLMAEITKTTSESVYLCTLPEAHNFALSCPGLFGVLFSGATFVIPQNPSFDECFDLIEEHAVTITPLVPALAKVWTEAATWYGADLSSLEVLQIGGSKLEVHEAKKIIEVFGPVLQQVFGTAEGLINATRLDDPESEILNTQGRPISEYDEYKIIADNGQEVKKGEIGELITRGLYTIRAYYKAPEKNKEAFTADGWYRMGDLVSEDEFGNFTVVGRIKEQINRAGEKIAPIEIEEAIAGFPNMINAQVIGVPDSVLGEAICLIAIMSEDASEEQFNLKEVREYLRNKGVPEWKNPDVIMKVTSFPVTAVGKIDKKALLQMYLEK